MRGGEEGRKTLSKLWKVISRRPLLFKMIAKREEKYGKEKGI